MYSKTFQHPVFPMREFVLRWEKRYEGIQLFYQGNLILEFENLKALRSNPTVEIDGIGKLEIRFLSNPPQFEISVNGVGSPQNHSYPAKKIKRRQALIFLPMLCYLLMAFVSYTESQRLTGELRVFDERIAWIGLVMFCLSLVTYITLLARIVVVYMIYYWFHVITGVGLFLFFLSKFQSHFGGNWQYESFIFTVVCFAIYFTGVFWLLRMLYIPCKKLVNINRMIAASEELLD